MNESATLIVAIIGLIITWTGSVIFLVLWLTGKFRSLEKALYREMDKHRREDDRQFGNHAVKIQRLEIKVFGFTGPAADPSLGPML